MDPFRLSGADRTERLQARQSFIPARARLVPGPAGGAAYIYDDISRDGRPRYFLLMFRGTAAKAETHVYVSKPEQRERMIREFHESIRYHAERRAKERADRKAWVCPAKVGDILYTSWGYDQTNVEFYAVTRVSGKRVWVRQICSDSECIGRDQYREWPAMPVRFVDKAEETMHIAQSNGDQGYSVKINESATAWLEDGRAHYSSCYH